MYTYIYTQVYVLHEIDVNTYQVIATTIGPEFQITSNKTQSIRNKACNTLTLLSSSSLNAGSGIDNLAANAATTNNKYDKHTTYAPATHQPTATTNNAYNLTAPASGTVTPTTDGSSGSGDGQVTPYIFSSTSNNITGNLINTTTHAHTNHTHNTTTNTTNKNTNKKSQSHPKLTKAGLLTNNTLLPLLPTTTHNPPKINVKAENKRPPSGEPTRKYTKKIRVPEPVFTSLSGFGYDIAGGEGEGEGEYIRTSSTLTTSSNVYINDNNTDSIFNCFNTTLSDKGHNYDPLTGTTTNNNHTGNDNSSIYNDLSLNDVSSLLLSMRSSASGRAYSNTALVSPTMYIHDIQQAIEAKEGHREC